MQPWQLEAPAGQRITVSVLDFARPSTARDEPAETGCRGRVYAFLVDKAQKTNVSVCQITSAGAPSVDGQANSEGRAALSTSSNTAELFVVTDDQLANNFLIRVEGQ